MKTLTDTELQTQRDSLLEALLLSRNYIRHVGLNHTEKGLPHPQQALLDKVDEAINLTGYKEPRHKSKF